MITYITYKKDDPVKAYVGFSSNNDPSYYGSGVLIKKALKKYGPNSFDKVILGEFDNVEEALYWESFYIKTLKTLTSDGGYNISTSGGWCPNQSIFGGEVWNKGIKCPQISGEKNGMYGKTHTKDARKRIAESRKGNTNRKGLTKDTDESIKRMAEKMRRPKETTTCPHCGIVGAVGLLKRYHFDNCKKLN